MYPPTCYMNIHKLYAIHNFRSPLSDPDLLKQQAELQMRARDVVNCEVHARLVSGQGSSDHYLQCESSMYIMSSRAGRLYGYTNSQYCSHMGASTLVFRPQHPKYAQHASQRLKVSHMKKTTIKVIPFLNNAV
eukprot:2231082-Pleurochrysis_carterae.AAC.1